MLDHPDRRRWLLAVVVAVGLLALCPFPVAAESRDEWQQPDRVMDDLGLKPGDTVADVGCGSGYFTLLLATAVREKGRVWAVDISLEALKEVRQRVEREKVTNVEIIQSEPTDTKLKAESVGAALLCDVIHEVPEDQRAGLMKSIAMALKPGGFLFLVDYRKSRDVTFDPYERLVPRDDLVKLATDAGLVLDAEFHYLKYQVFFRFRKAAVRSTAGAAAQSPLPAISSEPQHVPIAFDRHDGCFLPNGPQTQAAASSAVAGDPKALDTGALPLLRTPAVAVKIPAAWRAGSAQCVDAHPLMLKVYVVSEMGHFGRPEVVRFVPVWGLLLA